MKLAVSLIAVAGMTLAAGTAGAQSPDPKAIRRALADYGSCIVNREPEKAREFVLSGGFINRTDSDERILLSKECMPGEKMIRQALGQRGGTVSRARLRLPDVMIRWSVAQALFDRDAGKLKAADFAAVPALAYEMPTPLRTTTKDGDPLPADRIAEQQRRIDEKTADVALAKVGECVVRRDVAGARAALQSPTDTPEELAALKALSPSLAACIQQGQTLGFDRMSLRGSIAVAFYRLATAAQTNGAAS